MSIFRVVFARLVATTVLGFVATTSNAQDVLQYLSPANGTEVVIDTNQDVKVRWLRGSRPVVEGDIDIITTFGDLSVTTVTTDLNGEAQFSISSSVTGDATVTVSVEATSSDRLLHFIDPVDTATPFGDLVTPEGGPGQLDLLVFNDRIGFRGHPGVDIDAVSAMALAEDLMQLPPLDADLFVVRTKSVVGRDALRQLTARLESAYPGLIKKSGLVARHVRADQWYVVPHEVVLQFKLGTMSDAVNVLRDSFTDSDLQQSSANGRRFVFIPPRDSADDVFEVTARLAANDDIEIAEPNYMIALRQRNPTQEPGFAWQWTLEHNIYFGADDADVDAAGAWDFSTGSSDTTIAIIDRGFDVHHVDLVGNIWELSAGQFGIDLIDMDASDLSSTITDYIQYGHGTAVAGVAAADGTDGQGYTGICPECRLLLIRTDGDNNVAADAFDEAVNNDVNIISNSWGFWGIPTVLGAAIENAVNSGATVFFAMSNEDLDDCPSDWQENEWDISAHHRVIGVSGVTDYDRRAAAYSEAKGRGRCMDVVAPTRGGDQGVSTAYVEYDPLNPAQPIQTYVSDFGGTSAATPLVAGIAGLILDSNPNLTPIQVQYILQDTADRVDPVAAKYAREFGFSDPADSPIYGYGRVNALEAVRLVAPDTEVSDTHGAGRGGHDLFFRDHALDWGNTEKASTTLFSTPRTEVDKFKSVDIKIDVEPFQPQATTAAAFVALSHEEPEVGKRYRVYVRLRNRGPEPVEFANLKLIWAITGEDFPPLPSDFWTTFPGDHTDVTNWQPLPALPATDVAYSGASVAGCPGRVVPECLPRSSPPSDLAQVAMYTLAATDWDAAGNVGPTFFAVIDSVDDRAQGMLDPANSSLDILANVVQDNNVTLWTIGSAHELPVPGVCSAQVQQAVFVLLIIGILLLVYVIVTWVTGGTVPIPVYALLILALILLLIICMLYPGCLEAGLRRFGFDL